MNTFASHVSTASGPTAAAAEAVDAVARALRGARADLVVMLATPDLMHGDGASRLAGMVAEWLHPGAVIGCTAEGVIGTGRELEVGPALSLWAASLPGVPIEALALDVHQAPDGAPVVSGWPPALDPGAPAELRGDTGVVLLADPFSFPPTALRGPDGLGMRHAVVGGMASGGTRPGAHRLILDQRVMDRGAVGVAIPGLVPAVSQGCRPVGPEMTVTDASGGMVLALAGKPALERLREVIDHLTGDDRRLAEEGLLMGVVTDPNLPDPSQGDFLIRGIVGGDPATGAVAVGGDARVGQVVRLQVRDHHSAHSDLMAALDGARDALGGPAGGALCFSCNGRGTRMFPTPHHDAMAIRAAFGDIPVAGLFCNGEIGPVCGRTEVHGFTATMALFPTGRDV